MTNFRNCWVIVSFMYIARLLQPSTLLLTTKYCACYGFKSIVAFHDLVARLTALCQVCNKLGFSIWVVRECLFMLVSNKARLHLLTDTIMLGKQERVVLAREWLCMCHCFTKLFLNTASKQPLLFTWDRVFNFGISWFYHSCISASPQEFMLPSITKHILHDSSKFAQNINWMTQAHWL